MTHAWHPTRLARTTVHHHPLPCSCPPRQDGGRPAAARPAATAAPAVAGGDIGLGALPAWHAHVRGLWGLSVWETIGGACGACANLLEVSVELVVAGAVCGTNSRAQHSRRPLRCHSSCEPGMLPSVPQLGACGGQRAVAGRCLGLPPLQAPGPGPAAAGAPPRWEHGCNPAVAIVACPSLLIDSCLLEAKHRNAAGSARQQCCTDKGCAVCVSPPQACCWCASMASTPTCEHAAGTASQLLLNGRG